MIQQRPTDCRPGVRRSQTGFVKLSFSLIHGRVAYEGHGPRKYLTGLHLSDTRERSKVGEGRNCWLTGSVSLLRRKADEMAMREKQLKLQPGCLHCTRSGGVSVSSLLTAISRGFSPDKRCRYFDGS